MLKHFALLAAAFVALLGSTASATTFSVTNTNNSGTGSFRAAIDNFNSSGTGTDTIEFTVADGSVITLTSSLPAITRAGTLTITGGATASYCTIDGQDLYSLLRTTAATNITISGLTFEDGLAADAGSSVFAGGAVYANGTGITLTLTNCAFNSNSAIYTSGTGTPDVLGGAICWAGPVNATDCTFTGNLAQSTAGTAPNARGGAIASTSQITLDSCTFTSNSVDSKGGTSSPNNRGGGAVYTSNALDATDSSFASNAVTATVGNASKGGAIRAPNTTLDSCSFVGNSVTTTSSSAYGGGVAAGGLFTATNCSWLTNESKVTVGANEVAGGGIYCETGGFGYAITDCTFIGNEATGNALGVYAGGAYFQGGTVNVLRCVFRSNKAEAVDEEARGGALRVSTSTLSSTLNINDSEFSSNSVVCTGAGPAKGGAVSCHHSAGGSQTGTINITNSTLANNSSSSATGVAYGGALFTGSPSSGSTFTTLKNCTITGNSCTGSTAQGGGFMPKFSTATATVTVANTIIAGNTATGYPDLGPANSITSNGYNLIGNLGALNFSGNSNDLYGDTLGTTTPGAGSTESATAVDPLLNALASNGGPTQTCALQLASPAINGGDPAYAGSLTTDQRATGYPRIRGGRIDIGAWEAPTRIASINRYPPINVVGELYYRVTFETDVTGFSTSNLSLASVPSGASIVSVTGGPAVYTVRLNPGSGDGAITLSFANATGMGSNGIGEVWGAPFTGQTYAMEHVAPTVTLTPDNAGPVLPSTTVNFPANFSEEMGNFVTSHLALVHSGTSGGTVAITGGPQNFTIQVSGVSGNGSYTVQASGATDLVGNPLALVTSGAVAVDTVAPTLAALVPDNAGPVRAATTVTFPANFSENVGFTSGNVTINHSGTAGGSVGVTGGPQNYSVTVTGVTGNGSYTIEVGGVSDTAGNALAATVTSSSVTVDNTAPTLAALVPDNAGPVRAATTVSFPVNFSENVALTAGNVIIDRAGTAGGTVGVTGGPQNYNVTVTGVTGNGSYVIEVGGVSDAAGNPIASAISSDTVSVDNTAPTLAAIVPDNAGPVNASATVTFPVNFSENVAMTAGNVIIDRAGTAGGTVGVTGGPQNYSVTVTGVTGNGSYVIEVGGVSDPAGNPIASAISSDTVAVDNTAPTLAALVPDNAGPVNAAATVTFPVNFSENVGFTGGNVTINHSGTAGGSVGVTGGPQNYNVTVTGVTGNGSYVIEVGSVSDAAGNPIASAISSDTVAVDNTAPTLAALVPDNAGPVNASATVSFPVNFSENVGFAGGNVTINHSGTAGGSVGVTGGPQNYSVGVTAITGTGSYTITVGGVVVDPAGNALAAPVSSSAVSVVDNSAVGDWTLLED